MFVLPLGAELWLGGPGRHCGSCSPDMRPAFWRCCHGERLAHLLLAYISDCGFEGVLELKIPDLVSFGCTWSLWLAPWGFHLLPGTGFLGAGGGLEGWRSKERIREALPGIRAGHEGLSSGHMVGSEGETAFHQVRSLPVELCMTSSAMQPPSGVLGGGRAFLALATHDP